MQKYWLSRNSFAQGTIEYLVIIAVVVVLSLVVVGVLVNQTGSVGSVSSSVSKIGSSSGLISVSETVVDSGGDGVLSLLNNSGGTISVSRIIVDGDETNYSGVSLSQGDKKVFSLGNLGSKCICAGYEGKKKTCSIIVYTTSDYGLQNQFTTNVSVDCVYDAGVTNPSVLVQPVSYAITFASVKDSFTGLVVSDFNIDCDGVTYDLNNQSAPKTINFTEGTYSCVFSKSGYILSTVSVVSDSAKSLPVYLDPLGSNYIRLSACGTLSTADRNYVLDSNFGSGGACLIVAADNVRIYGNRFKITGDINASNSGARAYTGLKINNTIVDGNVLAIGADNASGTAFAGGTVTITDSNTAVVNTKGGASGLYGGTGVAGGAVIVTNSTTASITSNGGNGGSGGYATGGASGAITITGSITGAITSNSGNGFYSASSGAINITNSTVTLITSTGGRINPGSGGYATSSGVINITNSIATSITSSGGVGYYVNGNPGAITVINSAVPTINAIAIVTSGYDIRGGSGGAVSLTDSNVSTINTSGGIGSWGGGPGGGPGGAVTITNSNISTIVSLGGAGGSGGGAGGTGGNVTFNVCPTTVPSVTVTGGSPGGANGTISPPTCHNP